MKVVITFWIWNWQTWHRTCILVSTFTNYTNWYFFRSIEAGCLTLSCGDKALVIKRMKNRKVILLLCYIFWTIQKIMK